MGAQNVAQVFTHWAPRLTHREVVALAYMALISLDADRPAVYWGGWEAIARVLGLDPDANASSSRRQVTKVFTALTASGAVVSSGAAKKGVRAEYALALDPNTTWKPARIDGRKVEWTTTARQNVGPKRSQVSSGGWDQNGPTTMDQNGPRGWDQNGPKVGTEKVPPKRTEEQPEEYRDEQHQSPKVTSSPAALEPIEGELVESGDPIDAQGLVNHFVGRLAEHKITPKSTAGWKRSAASILNHGDDPETIGHVIEFALTDTFWAGKVLTLPALAERYGQLRMTAKAAAEKSIPRNVRNAMNALRIGAELEAEERAFDPWEHNGPHDSTWGRAAIETTRTGRCNDCGQTVDENLLHHVKDATGRMCEPCMATNGWEAA